MDAQTYEQQLGGMEQSLMGFQNSKMRDYGKVQSAYEKSLEVGKIGFEKSELLSKTLEELGAGGIGLVEGGKAAFKGLKKVYNKFKKGKSSQNEDEDLSNKEDISEDYDLDGLEADTDSAFQKISGDVSDLGEQALSKVKSAVSNVGEYAQNTMENAFNGVKNKINQFKENWNREDNMIDRANNQGSSENSGFNEKTDANAGKGEIEMKDMGNKGANEKVYDQEGNELSDKDFDPSDTVEGTDVTLEGGEETSTGITDAVTTGVDEGLDIGGDIAADAVDAVAAGSQALDWIPFVGELTMLFGLGATIVDGAVQAANAGKKYTQGQQGADANKDAADQRIAQINPAGHYAVASLNPLHQFQQ